MSELKEAYEEFIMAFMKSLKLDKFILWLNKILKKKEDKE